MRSAKALATGKPKPKLNGAAVAAVPQTLAEPVMEALQLLSSSVSEGSPGPPLGW